MNPIAEKVVPIKLGDRDLRLVFNVNTMVAFEDATGKFFLDSVSDLFSAAFPSGKLDPKNMVKNPLDLLRKISMKDLRALLWAANHVYDENDNPSWPLTQSQIGKLLSMDQLIPTFERYLIGHIANTPDAHEMGESPANVQPKPISSSPELPSTTVTSGEPGIELPADAFA